MDTNLTVKEAALYLRLSRSQVYAMVSRREIPHVRLGRRRIIIPKMELEKWLELRRKESN